MTTVFTVANVVIPIASPVRSRTLPSLNLPDLTFDAA